MVRDNQQDVRQTNEVVGYEWSKQVGLIKDYKIVGDTVYVEYWPPIRKLLVMTPTDGEIRAAARGIYEEYDNLGAGYTTAWGNLPAHEQQTYLRLAAAAFAAAERHKRGEFNG